ncbi:hypothetical protein BC828DRAFT_350930, partial [Blastocladiella britannica]
MRGYDFGAESHALASVRSAHDEELVAIRIDMEYNGTKFKDVFTWNVAETLLTPHKFAHTLVGDLELPSAMIIPISEAIDKQVAEHIRWRGGGWCAPRMEDLRFIIKLHIVVQQTMLVDEFEWDLLCPFNSPERFAARYCLELGLESEFCTLIAHSIREQIQLHLRALVNVRYQFDGTPVAKKSGDLSSHFLLPLEGPLQAYRGTAFHELFTPEFFQIAVQDKAHAEKDDDREARRKRRTGR